MIILHIGLHKAGSTTVQTYLRDNAEVLAEAGVLYPVIGRAERSIAHHRLAADLRAEEAEAGHWAEIVRLAEDNPSKRVVISSEGFQSADPALVRAMLGDHPVKVFCYHRDAAQRFVSVYGHGTKNGFRTLDFDRVFENQFTMKRTYIGDTLKAWAEAFGGANVRVRSLHPSCLVNGDLMADVFEVLGLGADAESRLGLRQVGARNVSPGWKALETLRALYDDLGPGRPNPETTPDGRTARGALLKRALQAEAKLGLGGKGRYLTTEQMQRCIELEDADIAGMQAAGIDCRLRPITLEGFEPRDFLPEFARIPGDEAAALLRDMLAAVTRDYALRVGRADEEESEGDEGEDEDDAKPAKGAAKTKGQKAREKRLLAEAAAGVTLSVVDGAVGGGVDPMKAAKQQAKAERKARKADFARVKLVQQAERAQGKNDRLEGQAERKAARMAAKEAAKAARGKKAQG